jgi:hypothetical protein
MQFHAEHKYLPKLVMVHHLISRSPAHLPHPFNGMRMNQLEYYQWCQNHGEQACLDKVAYCVRQYVEEVNRRGERAFPDSYLSLVKLLQQN